MSPQGDRDVETMAVPEEFPDGAAPDMDACRQVHEILGVVGDKWSLIVLGKLGDRKMRFGELFRAADGISQRMLTLTLRRLERDGLVVRTVHATVPPRVEYALTDIGAALTRKTAELGRWVLENRQEIHARQRQYDARAAAG